MRRIHMQLRSVTPVFVLGLLATPMLLAQTAATRVAGEWRGMWETAPITLTLKPATTSDKQAKKVDLTGTLSLPPTKDPFAAPNGPQEVSPKSDVTGTVDDKGVVTLDLTFPDLEGRSQPETFTGKVETDKATQKDTLFLTSEDGKTTLTLRR
jgi:hypothetical protein